MTAAEEQIATPSAAVPAVARPAMRRARFVLRVLFDLALLPVAAAVLVGRFGRSDWLFEMTNFFRPHLAVLALAMLMLAILAHGGWLRLAASALLAGAAVWPLLVPGIPMAKPAETRSLRLLTANVMRSNRDFRSFFLLVRQVDPDVISLEETGGLWRAALRSMTKDYPYTLGTGSVSTVSIYSRYPIRTSPVSLRAEAAPGPYVGGGPAQRSEIVLPGAVHPVVLYSIHPPTTRNAQGWLARNIYLDDVARAITAEPEGTQVIVAGDWNTPYWSPTLSRFIEKTGLVTTERSAWPPPTRFFREWHAPPFLGTPIDRVVVSPQVGLASIKVGQPFGSDHLPVAVDLALD